MKSDSILLLCYGNPGRLDDGLGPAFGARVAQTAPAQVEVQSDYVLNPEDAAEIAKYRTVVFVDAAMSGPRFFHFRKVMPSLTPSFSSHILEPEHLLTLAVELFGAQVEAYALEIRGYEFDSFGDKLSAGAQENLSAALVFWENLLVSGRFAEAAGVCTGLKTGSTICGA